MELEELLQAEGIAAEDLEETLAWARGRAEELAAELSADAELGPLLTGVGVSEPVALPDAPQPVARSSTEPSPSAPEESAASLADELAAELAAETSIDDFSPGSEAAAALADLPPPPERPDLPEVGPGVEAGPMADAAYDQGSVASPLPEPPLDEPLPGVPDAAGPAVEQPGVGAGPVDGPEDTTQPRELVSDGHEAPGVTHSGSIEIDEDEIELLDDDDLELVDDEDGSEAPAPPGGGNGHAEDVPEWQAALTSAQLGGGAKADHDSGLYRLNGTTVEKIGAQPQPEEPAPNPAAVDGPVENDESMDVDLGDL